MSAATTTKRKTRTKITVTQIKTRSRATNSARQTQVRETGSLVPKDKEMVTNHSAPKVSVMTEIASHALKETGRIITSRKGLRGMHLKENARKATNRRGITKTGATSIAAQIRITKTAPAAIPVGQQHNN